MLPSLILSSFECCDMAGQEAMHPVCKNVLLLYANVILCGLSWPSLECVAG